MGDALQKIVAVQLLVVSAPLDKVFDFDDRNLHYVSNVEVLNPFGLVQKPKHVPHVGLVLRLVSLTLELALVNGADQFCDLMENGKLKLCLLLDQSDLCVDLIHERKFAFKLHAVRAVIVFVLLCALFLSQVLEQSDLTVDRRVSCLG